MSELTNEQLQSISDLAHYQVMLEESVAEHERRLAATSEKLRNVREVLLPDAMMGVGLESFTLADGSSIRVDKFYAGKIPDDKAAEAFAWLRKNQLESIIKREVKCMFGKGEDRLASLAIGKLQELGANPTDKQGVHPMTLKSFIRERMENGQKLPNELFGVFVGNRAKVTPPKK